MEELESTTNALIAEHRKKSLMQPQESLIILTGNVQEEKDKIMQKQYTIKYRERPNAEIIEREMLGWNESDVKFQIKFEKEITLNQIEFLEIKELKK